MQRTIKFRAWDREMAVMFQPVGLDPNGIPYMADEDGEFLPDAIPMQYTCLKDKNGKEIYEGDIIENTGDTRAKYRRYQVVWRGHGFYQQRLDLKKSGMHIPTHEIEVIGNIYENPELLEATK